MRKSNPLQEKSVHLAVAIVQFTRLLKAETREFSICDQLLRSGTAPGALIAEAADSESHADMLHKFGIALKEARETAYWLDVLQRSGLVTETSVAEIESLLNEVTAMLVASKVTLRNRHNPK